MFSFAELTSTQNWVDASKSVQVVRNQQPVAGAQGATGAQAGVGASHAGAQGAHAGAQQGRAKRVFSFWKGLTQGTLMQGSVMQTVLQGAQAGAASQVSAGAQGAGAASSQVGAAGAQGAGASHAGAQGAMQHGFKQARRAWKFAAAHLTLQTAVQAAVLTTASGLMQGTQIGAQVTGAQVGAASQVGAAGAQGAQS